MGEHSSTHATVAHRRPEAAFCFFLLLVYQQNAAYWDKW